MEEKRMNARVRANFIVTIRVETSRVAGGSRINNISATGICMPSNNHFPVDTLVEVQIRSEELGEPLRALARVVRVVNQKKGNSQFEVGLVFFDIPLVKQRMLHHYVQRIIAQGERQVVS